MKDVNYSKNVTPGEYVCKNCSASGVKLWRLYNTCASELDLLCAKCAMEDQKKPGKVDEEGRRDSFGLKIDQIGWLVPAVPAEDGDSFWGYSSVPEAGVQWWRNIPTHLEER